MIRPDRARVVVAAAGELDLASAPQLDATVRELRASGWNDIVVDLHDVGFIDSSGLCRLAALTEEARRDGWKLSLTGDSPALDRVIELTALGDYFSWARLS